MHAPALQTYRTRVELTPVQNDTLIRDAATRAGRRIAPLWPLRHFVAVNPYLGLLEHSFASAAQVLGRRAGARMTAPRGFYAEAIRSGRISDADLAAAMAEQSATSGPAITIATLKSFALGNAPETPPATLPTVADVASTLTAVNWAELVTESIAHWAGTYFDLGQSYWGSPWADQPAYAAWRAEAAHDRTAEVRGVRGFRQTVAQLPASAMDTIIAAVEMLDIPTEGLDAYLHRLLLSIHGWASYARYQQWQAELAGGEETTLIDLLAIRLAWEVALFAGCAQAGIAGAWQVRKVELCEDAPDTTAQQARAHELLLQRAFEYGYQRQLFGRLGTPATATTMERARVQAAFCIDVRSEVFRRALETVSSSVETIGFAGFFGVPIEYVPLGETRGGAQCPVLLTPQFVVAESVRGAPEGQVASIAERRTINQRLAKAWRMFKLGPVSCFGFVGPVGLAYVRKLVLDTLGRSRPVPDPTTFGLDAHTRERLVPRIDLRTLGGRTIGMTLEQRIQTAEGGLRGMSLTGGFARVVLLAGHGSTTVNNPHATGLDCGACGGHTGEANARVAVQLLNDPAVRAGLQARGISIPEDTVFVAGLHDTTTDDLTLFDTDQVPASHADDLARLEADLAAAARLTRMERAALLDIGANEDIDAAVRQRSKDWSQVRPEWGLAGCAAFIAAPRQRTAGVDLGGRAFLHSYDWWQDAGFGVLELIMVAPMIVASWINLQYYGSTVDNQFFGSGNKTLHNIVGTLGVLEGNTGDIRVGLPWQSVHDGERYIHEPVRLHVLIEAPIDAMTRVIAGNEQVRQLIDNGWIHLFALDATGKPAHQYAGNLTWAPCSHPAGNEQA